MKSQSFLGSRTVLILSALLVLGASSITAFAQQGTSTVRGTVKDPQANVVSGATVTLINPGTNASRSSTTSEAGVYSFEFVQPGDYRLEVEATGFKKAVITDVHALVAKPSGVDVELEVGNVTESVTVAAGAGEVLINRDDATLGNNFVNQQISQLPLEARNVLSLLTLQPGVTPDGYVTGARSDQSNITLDGVDINEAQANAITAPVLRLNAEAVEEFRVVTANANATQGRSSGAQISLVTKGGTNDFHGSAFWFHRPTNLTSNNFFNNRSGVPREQLIRNTYGGAIGGPIKKDRLFLFYSFEGRRDVSQTSVVRVVPLASLGRGELRYVNRDGTINTLTTAQLNTIFPSVGINPVGVAALAQAASKYPANDFTVGDSTGGNQLNTAGHRFNSPLNTKLSSHSARFDFNITNSQQFFVRANAIHDTIGGTRWLPDTPSRDTWSHPWGLAAGHTWTINSSFVNKFTYGLTRDSFTTQGDSAANSISFRFVFSPLAYSRSISRTTPVHNIADDVSWVKGNHSWGFGTNIRLIRNRRASLANSFDSAITNPSFYAGAGQAESGAINTFCGAGNNSCLIGSGFASVVQNATTALIGRFSQYSGNFIFNRQGSIEPAGTPSVRDFATEEYDFYVQDSWRFRPNLTFTLGLRYSNSRPVYERQGFETKPDIALAEYYRRRRDAEVRGVNYDEPILIELSGPANDASPLYRRDNNNFQPRVAIAWSPNFKSGFLHKIFGNETDSVIRGGFAITNDYYGQQIAVTFDLNNQLGFSSGSTTPFGTYNTGSRPAPLFTSYTQDVRSLPNLTIPGNITFPRNASSNDARRIERSFDEEIVAPINYSWNLTYERKLAKGLVFQTSYVGRKTRNLLASRDVLALSNLVDTKSGTDWYTAATQLEILRSQGVPISAIPSVPWFQNILPAGFASQLHDLYDIYYGPDVADLIDPAFTPTQAAYASVLGFNGNDWTTLQSDMEDATGLSLFYQSQYGALAAWGSIAKSNYHAGTLSLRQRLGEKFSVDFNYTFSKSMDDASGLQTEDPFGGAFILNPIRQQDSYALSDFDIKHIINVNSVWQLPLGRGQWVSFGDNGVANTILGGWQLSGIFRWNSGLPISVPYDASTWATNWNFQSNGVRTGPVQACPTRGDTAPPKLFGCDPVGIYRSFRNARPGESGDRNVLRLPGYVVLDMGVGKSFNMPWSENHKLQIRFEAFNVTNTQRLGTVDGSRTGYGLSVDPASASPAPNFSNFTAIQGDRRVMQFGFRYSF